MKLEIACLSLGPVGTNCYIVVDAVTREAIVVDPGWDAHLIVDRAEAMKAKVRAVWLTHSHFDHIGGVAGLVRTLNIPVALHLKELPLYKMRGGAKLFGLDIDEPPEPTIKLEDFVGAHGGAPLHNEAHGDAPLHNEAHGGVPLHNEAHGGAPLEIGAHGGAPLEIGAHGRSPLQIGSLKFEVRYVPGHTQGHVAFYQKDDGVIFSGDVLFQGSIGRTDLPGGNYEQLISSIQTQLLTLPDSTIVYSGHGEPTTIGEERE
ncbi:MAG: MBL fold metallo-hydrolase, partial [Chloroflexi bacterium]|nr:MBL fold metallo-hydrolase [Chloroflexota bacterium]